MIYAAGSGLIEVLVSPIVEACPFDNKDSVMSCLLYTSTAAGASDDRCRLARLGNEVDVMPVSYTHLVSNPLSGIFPSILLNTLSP